MTGYLCALLTLLILANGSRCLGKEAISEGSGDRLDFPCPAQCKCDDRSLTVSCVKANLTFLPHGLSNRTRKLDLSENKFTHLSGGMFRQVPRLFKLLLTNNQIRHIDKFVFRDIHALQFLDIGQNPLGGSGALFDLLSGLSMSPMKLRKLAIDGLSMNATDQDALKQSNLRYLGSLDLSANSNIGNLQEGIFSPMKVLGSLTLEALKLSNLNPLAMKNLHRLQYLSLANNTFSTFPDFFPDGQPLVPSLVTLDFSYNFLSAIAPDSLRFKHLEKFYVRYNVLTDLVRNNFANLPALKALDLEHNRIKTVDPLAFASSSILSINLNDNKIVFDARKIMLFRHPMRLQQLIISNNRRLTTTFFESGFQNLTDLQYLGMNSLHGLGNIPKGVFYGLDNLNTLQYSDNTMDSLDRDVFENLPSLTHLTLSSNLLTVINSTSFPRDLLENLKQLDLSDNLFRCDCGLLWFTTWLNVTQVNITFYPDRGYYKCNTPAAHKGMPLRYFQPPPNQCLTLPMSEQMRISIAGTLLMVILVAIVSGVYRWKWRLRFMVFHLSSWWTATQTRHKNGRAEENHLYDAFIGYNSEDSEWVNNVLLVELEHRSDPPFRLCLYERDWLPGYGIINCIGESIESSRKTILVVTNSFAQSQWCQLELTMAQHKLFEEDQDSLILAIMEDIDPLNLTPRLALEMKRRTYLTWTEDAYGQQLFWEKLKKSLQKPLHGVSTSVPPMEEFCDLSD